MGEKDPLYTLLRKLRSRRQLGEARRLFYVAVTRARRELVMSGLARRKGDSFSTAAESPLGWLSEHYGIDELCGIDRIAWPQEIEIASAAEWKRSTHSEDGFIVEVEPDCDVCNAIPPEIAPSEIAPAEFEREKPVFTVISPSRLTVFEPGRAVGRREWAQGDLILSCAPNIWGTLVHRLLAEFGKNGTLPSAQRASAYLRRMGTESSGSLGIAHAALSEVKTCLDDPWLQALYNVAPERRRVESPVECTHERGTLYSGVIDLAVEIEGKWNLVDFKTSMPLEGESAEDFFRRESEVYRPQILGYCEIWAKLTGTDQRQLLAFIYWTALRKNTKVLL